MKPKEKNEFNKDEKKKSREPIPPENSGHEICDEAEENKTDGKEASNEKVELNREEYDQLLTTVSEASQLKDRFLRSAADFENAKKRLLKEKEDFIKYALESFIYELLPVLDNFERAVNHTDENDPKTKALYEGFRLIEKQFMMVLAVRGLKRIDALKKPFDPNLHEAVGHVISEADPEGTVMEEMVAGYELNGRLIRPAKVKISKKAEASSGQTRENDRIHLEEEKKEELT
ncbi:MAG: nucleotide exchange factor GrpE [Omnitrophica bacterium RIFCSPLOWO2_12_FULL_44_17]|uniref:Protein GrpE n=1 Tax=Candidatus Danuiimicrobium aquiferis TaxID=1801832 RepID=A0A1G1L2F1_9BACT|nr:MAG: nucleotide exchange factor GrpE [Omnitrophica bacterium RIFCSPHIGHO2_02_FULL_45_28]OGW99049.1 MAG: nucleotide exchange factor GrpE [Omnitrophica bacterium RIFCSPLOWO2_12_FULL_44_17]OGX04125.1 MAG: nucleotide exchange factor GrpE [Omnitrophica bacterium RIFCSPLOWO2_02_FULL_44_11]